nr:unnamed protein product [Digitaria exilis]
MSTSTLRATVSVVTQKLTTFLPSKQCVATIATCSSSILASPRLYSAEYVQLPCDMSIRNNTSNPVSYSFTHSCF